MADSSAAAAAMVENDIDLASVLPIGPIMPSNSDVAKTLPFCYSDFDYGLPDYSEKSQELRAACLERTKQRWVWFSKAEYQDRERGTQLGTLGYLPWEVRQKVFLNLFHREDCPELGARGDLDRMEKVRLTEDPTHSWDDISWNELASQDASANIKLEVHYAYITTTHFHFSTLGALTLFLGRLTKYQKSLLRHITIPMAEGFDTKAGSEIMRDACAELPSGLTHIAFTYTNWFLEIPSLRKKVDSFDLLCKRIRRCCAPRAKISFGHVYRQVVPKSLKGKHRIVSCEYEIKNSAHELESWSQDWLDWWASSQNHDQAEEQSFPPKDNIDES